MSLSPNGAARLAARFALIPATRPAAIYAQADTDGAGTAAAVGINRWEIGSLLSRSYSFDATAADNVIGLDRDPQLAVGDRVTILTSSAGGVTVATTYYVKTVTGADLTLSATPGGATLDVSSNGSGTLQTYVVTLGAESAAQVADAGAAWTHVSLWDAATDGNRILSGALHTPRTISTGVSVYLTPDSFKVQSPDVGDASGGTGDLADGLLLDWLLIPAETPVFPTELWIGLSTTAPGDSGATVTEISGDGISRLRLDTGLNVPGDGTVGLNAPLDWTAAGSDPGTPGWAPIWTAESGGEFWGWLKIADPPTWLDTQTLRLSAGTILTVAAS